MSITAYSPTKNYADDSAWTKAKMDSFVDNLDSWLASEVEGKCPDKTGSEHISGVWSFDGAVAFTAATTFTGSATFSGASTFVGSVALSSTMSVAGLATYNGGIVVNNSATFSTNIKLSTDLTGFIDNSGNELAIFDSVASAVNYLRVINAATGGAVVLRADGDDTNINLEHQSKGTGSHVFTNSAGNTLASIVGGSSIVNYLALTPKATGISPSLDATGADSNLDLVLNAKGTGLVKSGTATLFRTDTYNESTYSTADISIGTTNDGAFADVDATNAKITFTVNVPGRYRVDFEFPLWINVTAASASFNSITLFRLTDGTNNSFNHIERHSEAVSGGINFSAHDNTHYCCVSHVFNFSTTGSKTVKLQKQNTGSTAITTRQVMANGGSPLIMRAVRISE